MESLIGARRLEPDPLFMPSAWERELELQRQRLRRPLTQRRHPSAPPLRPRTIVSVLSRIDPM